MSPHRPPRVYALGPTLVFPDPELAGPEGLLAYGGDLRPERLLLAYAHGIFPWYTEGEPILWWSPDPRAVLPVDALHVGRTLRRSLRRRPYRITADRCFADVVAACARVPRRGQRGTWITAAMQRAYTRLHALGHAHSVEVWQEDTLVGGLYGVLVGRCFSGESMFSLRSDASKIALVHLVRHLARIGVPLVDCQVPTAHLASMGARCVPRRQFLAWLAAGMQDPIPPGRWTWTVPPPAGAEASRTS